jgi:hypothetical protein
MGLLRLIMYLGGTGSQMCNGRCLAKLVEEVESF